MKIKALIFDLDNTIYPVASIARELFSSLFRLLDESGELNETLNDVKQDLMRKPFQWVAKTYGFTPALTQQGTHLLENLVYEGPIQPFADYEKTKSLPLEKYLVTSGFQKLQESKIRQMGLHNDFREIHIVDVQKTTKLNVFAGILQRHGYQPLEVAVVGDDPESEIKAALDLGMVAVLYDKSNRYADSVFVPKISDFGELSSVL